MLSPRLLTLFAAVLAGCGQAGPLVLPDAPAPTVPAPTATPTAMPTPAAADTAPAELPATPQQP